MVYMVGDMLQYDCHVVYGACVISYAACDMLDGVYSVL